MNLLPRLCELKPHAHYVYVQTTSLVAQQTHGNDGKKNGSSKNAYGQKTLSISNHAKRDRVREEQ